MPYNNFNNRRNNNNNSDYNENSQEAREIYELMEDILTSARLLLDDTNNNNFMDFLSLIRKYRDFVKNAQPGQPDMNAIHNTLFRLNVIYRSIVTELEENDPDISDKIDEFTQLYNDIKSIHSEKMNAFNQNQEQYQGGKRRKRKATRKRRAIRKRKATRRRRS
jgi:hypothetical protein